MEKNTVKELPDPEELWEKNITLSDEEEKKLSYLLCQQASRERGRLEKLHEYKDIKVYEGEDFSPYTWFVTFALIDRNCESLEKQLNKEMLITAYEQQFVSTISALSNNFEDAFDSMVGTINRKILLGNIHVLTEKLIKAIPPAGGGKLDFGIFIRDIYYKYLPFDEVAKSYGTSLRTVLRYNVFLKKYINTYLKDVLTMKKMQKMIGGEKWVLFFAKYIDEFVLREHENGRRKDFRGTQIKLHCIINNNHLLRYSKKKGDKLTK